MHWPTERGQCGDCPCGGRYVEYIRKRVPGKLVEAVARNSRSWIIIVIFMAVVNLCASGDGVRRPVDA